MLERGDKASARTRAYLDTSAYNLLAGEKDWPSVVRKLVRDHDVWASFENLTEIAATPDGERRTRLLDVLVSFMEDKAVLAPAQILLARALEADRSAAATLQFGCEPSIFKDDVVGALGNIPADYVGLSHRENRKQRKELRDWRNEIRKHLSTGTSARHGGLMSAQIPNLREVLRHVFEDAGRLRFHFEDDLRTCGASAAQLDLVQATLHRALVWYPWVTAELVRRYLAVVGPSRKASTWSDTHHAAYLPAVEVFITSDEGQARVMRETVAWCYPTGERRVEFWAPAAPPATDDPKSGESSTAG